MSESRIRFGEKVYVVDGLKGTAFEITESGRIPVANDNLINALVCEYWEPRGRYSGT